MATESTIVTPDSYTFDTQVAEDVRAREAYRVDTGLPADTAEITFIHRVHSFI